jgi:HK97 family phage portal protein
MDVDRVDGELAYSYAADSGQVKLTRWNLLHVPGLGFDGIMGYSPIALAKNSIGMALATEEYGSSFFKNGANPGGVLEFPNTVKDIKRLKETWNAGYQGSDNAHRIAILEEGAKFNPISIPPNEAQFLETRRYQLEEIARIYRVPLHLVGDLEHATFSNIEHQSLSFVKFTLMPWVRRLEQAFETALLPPWEQGRFIIKFSVEGLLRGDFKSRYEGYAVGIRNGWLSVNDVRRLEEMNLIPSEEGGDYHFVNGAAILLKDIGAAYKTDGNIPRGNQENTDKEDSDEKQSATGAPG